MDLSKIKLIVTDMDGTLLNSKGEVNPELPALLEEIKKLNIKFAVASGRQYYSLIERLAQVKDEVIFIAENGAIVMEKGEQKHLQPFPPENAVRIIKTIKKAGGKYLILSGKKGAYIEKTTPEFMKPFLKHYEKYEVVKDIAKVENDDFLKVTVCDLLGAEQNLYPRVNHLKEEFQVKLSGEIWIDFNDNLAQKGNALQKIQQLYQIQPQETVAFGDYLNDMELFDHAHFSFAMGNAHPKVKERARYSTGSNDEQGVEKILKDIIKECKAVKIKEKNA